MPVDFQSQSNQGLVEINGDIAGFNGDNLEWVEVSLTESLTTPSLQTSILFHADIFNTAPYLSLKGAALSFTATQMYPYEGYPPLMMSVGGQDVYRMDNRDYYPINMGKTEKFVLHACDATLLNDAQMLVSRSWICTTPGEVVKNVLEGCAGAINPDIESDTGPARDYIAERYHPFQVVAQQGNVALAGNNPDFVHYMTYDQGFGKHHFRSLTSLCNASPKVYYQYGVSEVLTRIDYTEEFGKFGPPGTGLNPFIPLSISFPCDFDKLSDLLNGLGDNGDNINVASFFNPLDGSANYVNGQSAMCSRGANFKHSMTNSGTQKQQGTGCKTNVEQYLLKRQARMALLEKDKVALRIVSPWAPQLHAGDLIHLQITNAEADKQGFGSGTYLISSMTHKFLKGGYTTTTLDCVRNTVSGGVV